MKIGSFIWFGCVMALSGLGAPTERSLAVESGSHTIEGVLFSPSFRAEVVCVVIPGSGAVMRDGRMSGVPTSRPIYSELASALASRGIATFIYEKRWIGRPDLASTFTEEDHLTDLAAIVRELKNEYSAERLVLFGHSEGGALAVVLAGRCKQIDAVVIAASASFPIDELLVEQLASNPALRREVEKLIAKMRAGRFPHGGTLLGASRDYWMQWIEFTSNMAAYTKKFSAPIFVVQGEADASLPGSTLERNITSWRKIAEERGNARVRTYPGVDHFLVDTHKKALSEPLLDDVVAFSLRRDAAGAAHATPAM